MQHFIKEAKSRAWDDLCQTLEEDPWERPYRIVLGKLRPRAQPVTESLEPTTLDMVLSALFPDAEEETPATRIQPGDITSPPVTEAELSLAIAKMSKKSTAPGPDGIPGRALALALPELSVMVRSLFDKCLQAGYFPKRWKTAKLVLIQKPGKKDLDSPSTYRPICLDGKDT